jgi:small conductance mechanosensitive channel
MNEPARSLGILRSLQTNDVVLVVSVLALAWLLAWLLAFVLRSALRRVAEAAPTRLRLPILRAIPILRLGVVVAALALIVPLLVEPSLQNVVAIVASVGLALAFVVKDYASSLVAGVVTILEGPYQPGDWIQWGDTYGEVKLIGVRAVHLVTIDDNELIIPHSRLWSSSISNATSGSHSVLCITDFYLHPDHDGELATQCLAEVGRTSAYLMPGTKISVAVRERSLGAPTTS